MSRTQTQFRAGDPTPVTGGVRTPARLLRPASDPDVEAPSDPLDRHLLRLLTLHKDRLKDFQGVDLSAADDAAKRTLLIRIQGRLGIKVVPYPRPS